jgi:hypothetical protein
LQELVQSIYSLAVMERVTGAHATHAVAIDRMVARLMPLLPSLTSHSLCNLIW